MTRANLLAWILSASSAFADGHGHAFPRAPLALAAGIVDAALADASSAAPLFPDARTTAALLLKIASRESGYRTEVVGDGGKSCGAFQTPCASTPLRDPVRQPVLAIAILRRSFALCPEAPLAPYASGRCDSPRGRAISADRLADVRRVLELVEVTL